MTTATFFDLYSTGTISVTNGGAAVTSSGAVFADIIEGDILVAQGLLDVVDTVTGVGLDGLTLKKGWPGATAAAIPYMIIKMGKGRYDPALTQAYLRQVVAFLAGAGIIYAVTNPATVPDPAVGIDGQYALKTDIAPWKQWLKVGGVWVLQSTPVGINNRGTWSSASTYAANDVVTRLSIVYLSNTVNTNKPPESNPTDWSIFGAQGLQGATWRTGSGVPSNGLGVDTDLYLDTATGNVYVRAAGAYTLAMNIRGIAGTTLQYGIGAPSNGLGNNGDFYISTDTHILYGPKAAGVWPAGMSLVGTQGPPGSGGVPGQNGAPGKSLLYGAAAPGTLDGNDGDFWYATGTKTLYGPKAGGTWPAGTSLQGNIGPPGATGTGIQPDATGTLAQRAAFNTQAQGYKFLETDVSPFQLFIKASATSGDWAGPTFIGGQGPVGDGGHITDAVVQTFDGGHIV